MGLTIKIYLTNDEGEKYMGIGVLWLLDEVGKTGSLRKAAANLDIAYSKGYSMVKRAEEAFGIPLLERRKGGKGREGSTLTPFAKEFLELYRSFQQEVKDKAVEPYQKFTEALEELKRREENGRSSI